MCIYTCALDSYLSIFWHQHHFLLKNLTSNRDTTDFATKQRKSSFYYHHDHHRHHHCYLRICFDTSLKVLTPALWCRWQIWGMVSTSLFLQWDEQASLTWRALPSGVAHDLALTFSRPSSTWSLAFFSSEDAILACPTLSSKTRMSVWAKQWG